MFLLHFASLIAPIVISTHDIVLPPIMDILYGPWTTLVHVACSAMPDRCRGPIQMLPILKVTNAKETVFDFGWDPGQAGRIGFQIKCQVTKWAELKLHELS